MAKSKSRPKSSKTLGRYVAPEARGRITQRRNTNTVHSPSWYGWLLIDLMLFGVIVITLNYLEVLPGSTSGWYLVGGLVSVFLGFYLATRYR